MSACFTPFYNQINKSFKNKKEAGLKTPFFFLKQKMNLKRIGIFYLILTAVVVLAEKYVVNFLSKYLTFLSSIPIVIRFIALFIILLIADISLHKFYSFT